MKHKECFINDSSCNPINKETGKPKIKEAHILSRAATMSLICGEGKGGLSVVQSSSGEEVGWKKASAYHCFCGVHDDEIFNPIENDNSFDPKNKEQLFLHSFRSFAYTYHQKRSTLDGYLDSFKWLTEFAGIDDLQERYDAQMNAYEYIKSEMCKSLIEKNYDALKFRVYRLKTRFPFASAGTLMADIVSTQRTSHVFFEKGQAQLLRPGIMLTTFPDPHIDKTNVVLACLRSDKNATFYLDKYSSLSHDEIRRAVSSLMITTNGENTFFHPKLWKYFKEEEIVDSITQNIFAGRGKDLLMDEVHLSDVDLFKKEYSCSALEIDN